MDKGQFGFSLKKDEFHKCHEFISKYFAWENNLVKKYPELKNKMPAIGVLYGKIAEDQASFDLDDCIFHYIFDPFQKETT